MILEEKSKIFIFSLHIYFPESGSGKRFQASGMRAIDSPHEITTRNMILSEKFQNFSIFASIHTFIFLNQGQGSVFTLRECAQSIFRMILPLYRLFWQKKFFLKLVPDSYPLFKKCRLLGEVDREAVRPIW